MDNRIVAAALIASIALSSVGCTSAYEKSEESSSVENVQESSTEEVSINDGLFLAIGDSVGSISPTSNTSTPTPTPTPTPSLTPTVTPTPTPIPAPTSDNVTSLAFASDEDIEVTVGEEPSIGELLMSVNDANIFSIYDVVFVSENPEIAHIGLSRKVSSEKMLYAVKPLAEGETYVYAQTSDGVVSSERVRVVVNGRVEIESIWVEESYTLEVGDTAELEYEISPDDATNQNVTWKTNNSRVVTVDANGCIKGISEGKATIYVTAEKGHSATCEVTVICTRKEMNLKIQRSGNQGEYIGGEWHHNVKIDGESVKNGKYTVSAGETLEIYCRSEESDSVPDVGDETVYYTVTEEDIAEGFEVEVVVEIEENRGRNAGNVAVFTTTLVFTP